MKNLAITFFLLLIGQLCIAQTCGCKTQPELKNVISCDQTIFKNGAKLYWQYNCDSSWVIFENKEGKKKHLFSLEGELMGYTGRLGFGEWTEYKNTFMIEYHTVSGCCDPYEYILYNKYTGRKIENIGRAIFKSEEKDYPYFVTIDKDNFNYLSFLNMNTDKIFKVFLPKNRIQKTLTIANQIFAEVLFETGEIKEGVFEVRYKYKTKQEGKWMIGNVRIDLKKYSK